MAGLSNKKLWKAFSAADAFALRHTIHHSSPSSNVESLGKAVPAHIRGFRIVPPKENIDYSV